MEEVTPVIDYEVPGGLHVEWWLTDDLSLHVWHFPNGGLQLMRCSGPLDIPLAAWLCLHRRAPHRRLDWRGGSMTYSLHDARTGQEG